MHMVKLKNNVLSCIQLFATLWTVACQAPLSVGFFQQEYWSGLPFPSPEDLPNVWWQPTPVFLPGESQGWASLVGCHLWGHTELNTTEVMQQQQQQF